MNYVIGIDLGTSGVKAVLFSENGDISDIKISAYSPDFGPNGYSEQDPEVWWEHTCEVIGELTAGSKDLKANIKAVCCSGQMHSSVFLDSDGNVIRKAILWNDTRTAKQAEDIYKKAGDAASVLEKVSNLAMPGFTLPKILWLKENEPGNFNKVAKVIMPKDYINYRLTDIIKTDVSDAAGTLCFDVKNGRWSEELMSLLGLNPNILPDVLQSTGIVGCVKPEIADKLGLPRNVLVIAGGADNSCAAVGNGVVSEGQAVISVGTSGTVIAYLNSINSANNGSVHLFNYSVPDKFYAMGCMLSAGECLNWLKRTFFTSMSFDELNVLASKSHAGSNGLIFLPYIHGERCPHNDANARGVFFGLSGITTQGDLIRSAMEGVAFGLRDMFGLVSGLTDIEEIFITGGGAASGIWGQIISDVLGRSLTVSNTSEAPAAGAARIACVGSGIVKDFSVYSNSASSNAKIIEPDMPANKVYSSFYQLYKQLYLSNKQNFYDLQKL